jgi:hypothetical protein
MLIVLKTLKGFGSSNDAAKDEWFVWHTSHHKG